VDLLKALGMPFQLASLLFVAVSSLLLALVTGVGGATFLIAIFSILILLVWLVRYAFELIDDAANGVHDAATASAEMLSIVGDPRCLVHPVLAVAAGVALSLQPEVSRLAVLAAAALLFPASIGASAISGRARDALNPVAMMNVVRGLAHYYVLAVLWTTACVMLGAIIADTGLWSALRIAIIELLILQVYVFIGGAVYARRTELGFTPRVSPERQDQRVQVERETERQRMIDGLYRDLRVRETARATTSASQWLQQTPSHLLAADVNAILAAGAGWSEPRTYPQLLRNLVPVLISMRQTALAFAAVEAGLAASPGFAVASESDAIAMIRFAQLSGRKRAAATLLANHLASVTGKSEPGPALQQLRAQLQADPPAV
jgi:hypothetical protein